MAQFIPPYLPADLPDHYRGQIAQLWQLQQLRYEQMWGFYSGQAWQALDHRRRNSDGSAPRRYRLGVNDISLACIMHAQALFGEVRDNSDPLLAGKVEARKGQDAGKEDIERAQDFLDELWGESLSRKSQFIAALSSQVTGGVFWRVRYALDGRSPFDLYPFKLEPVHADYVFPVFATGSNRLSEVFVRYKLPREAARAEWGTWSNDWPEMVEYREHWTRPVGNLPGTLAIHVGVEGHWRQVKAERNPFDIVPFVYIPHVPSQGFYGIPLAEWAVDLAVEYNERLANAGDLMKQNASRLGILANHATGKLKNPFRLWKDGPPIIDLGQGLPDRDAPSLDFDNPPNFSQSYVAYLGDLKKELRMAMSIPPVAMGEDEGSQRSALTLMFRMFPMKSHVTTERWLWGPEYTRLCRMALHMARVKQVLEVDPRRLTVVPIWAPMFPKDREELFNELVTRQAAGHIHPKHALMQYGDIPENEIDEAYEMIKEHMAWEAELGPKTVDGLPATPVGPQDGRN